MLLTATDASVEPGELDVLVLETPRDEAAYERLARVVDAVVTAMFPSHAVLALARTRPGLPTSLTVVPPDMLGDALDAGARRGGAATFVGPPDAGDDVTLRRTLHTRRSRNDAT